MKYTEEMILQSESGYCMPFEERKGKDVKLSLGYGEQTDPTTGKTYFHHGIDFDVRCYTLAAVASGIVSGIGNDPILGICQTIRYGEYEVTYGHLSNVFAQFGQRVKAGQTVALSGDKLHIGIRFKGEELNPLEFLTMLYGNIQALCHADGGEAATSPNMDHRLRAGQTGNRGIDATFPALLHGRLTAWCIPTSSTYGAVTPPCLYNGSSQRIFL